MAEWSIVMTYLLNYLNGPYFIVSILTYFFDMQSYILRIQYVISEHAEG